MDKESAHSLSAARLIVLLCLISGSASFAQTGARIQKCQDAQGRWHYGSFYNTACRSEISNLNLNGVEIDRKAPFAPTSGLQQAAIIQQQTNDQRLLLRYSSIASIEREKERKLAELKKQQSINLDLIDKMGSDMQQLNSLNSLAAKTALDDRQTAIRQYESKHRTLSRKIEQINAQYTLLISDYLQALARSDSSTHLADLIE